MVKIRPSTRRDESADVDENRTASDETVVRDRATDRPAEHTDNVDGAARDRTDRVDGAARDRTDRVDDAARDRADRVDDAARAGRTGRGDGAARDRGERPTLWGRWSDRDRTRAGDRPTGRAVPVAPGAPGGPAASNAPTDAERRLAGTDLTDTRPTDTRSSDTRPAEPGTDDRPEPAPEVAVGPRPRTSVLATLSLIFALAGAFFVLSGALAGYGIAVGAIGFLLAVSAFAATRKRHVAGKLDATLGLLIGGAAVVIGILAFTGTFTWPNTDADWAERLRGWLDSQFVDRF